MPSLFRCLLAAIVALSVGSYGQLGPEEVARGLERRWSHHKPKPSPSPSPSPSPLPSPSPSPNPKLPGSDPIAVFGNPNITCPTPQVPKWTIKFDPIPPGCYEQGQKVDLTWKIVEARKASEASLNPVIYFLLIHYNSTTKHDEENIRFAPISPPIFHGDYDIDYRPICATDEFTTVYFPPRNPDHPSSWVYPTLPVPWTLAAFAWTSYTYHPRYLEITSNPKLKKLNSKNGFFIAAPGGCKDFKPPN